MTTDLKHQEELDRLRSQVTRLRAALAVIRDLQPTEPVPPAGSDDDYKHGRQDGLYEASSLAAAALGGGT